MHKGLGKGSLSIQHALNTVLQYEQVTLKAAIKLSPKKQRKKLIK